MVARYPGSCREFPRGLCTAGNLCSRRHDLYRCSCGLILPFGNKFSHERGRRHEELLREGTQPPESPNLPPEECPRCQAFIPSSQARRHYRMHLRQDTEDARATLAQDKNNVKVFPADVVDFGVTEENESRVLEVGIMKTSNTSAVALSQWWMGSSQRRDGHGERFSVTLQARNRWLRLNKQKRLMITSQPAYEGQHEDTLFLVFNDTTLDQKFTITRRIKVVVGSPQDHEQLQPTAPYVRQERPESFFLGRVIKSTRPSVWSPTQYTRKLGQFKPPKDLLEAVFGSENDRRRRSERAVLSTLRTQFLPPFKFDTYGDFFKVLLHIEEERQRMDMDNFAIEGAELKSNYPRYELKVKGLSEGRPSVLVGDFIEVRRTGEHNEPWYQGRVHRVGLESVQLQFPEEFNTYRGTKFDVRFVLNRLSYRRMQEAITNKNKPMRFLFPNRTHNRLRLRVTRAQMDAILPVNRAIGDDDEQLETVTAIVNLPLGSVPFIVFGPPGTGKTVTVVEAINQILLRDPDAHIMACAPSNKAADLLAEKLTATHGPMEVFRLNSLTRKVSDLPGKLTKFSAINDNQVFFVPPKEQIEKYKIVVSTCITASVPNGIGMKNGHFDFIFIDECAQATEPAAMIPIKSLSGPRTNVVLAGDHQQLGPVVRSVYSHVLGLKESYMGRLMDIEDVYDLEKSKGLTVMKLVKNFRAHPAILEFCNNRFYNGELVACAEPILINSLTASDILPSKKNFPVMFHAIVGKDKREQSSPSFFNIEEASLVKKYCGSLLADRRCKIKTSDIGIITPYHAQRCKILELLERDPKLRGISVGSIEEFQGQERRVIIISTVRSTEDLVQSDIRRMLGFVANPRRFNVALTRAQALLLVVGNPRILSLDMNWRGFLNYVHNRGGWRGVPISWDPTEPLEASSSNVPDGFEGRMRMKAVNEAEDMLERLKAVIAIRNENDDFGVEVEDDDGDDGDGEGEVGESAPAIFREQE